MKKLAVLLAIVAVMAVTFIPATPAFANSGNGNGFRGAGAGVGMMGQSNTGTSVNGVLHEYLIAAYADALDLSVDEIEPGCGWRGNPFLDRDLHGSDC